MTDGYELDPNDPATVTLQANYERRSRQAATLPGAQLNRPYGPDDRQRLDVFSAGATAPCLVFFHGGYWRAGSKDARLFPAPCWRARGVSWVAVNYRLLPDHSLAQATADARAATVWLADNATELGLDSTQLHVAGNSAGGHLAAMVAADGWKDRPRVASLTAISGLFDLGPLVDTAANAWLRLDSGIVQDLSPIHHLPPPGLEVLVGWGGAETREFEDQSRAYAETCRRSGNPVEIFASAGADHFRIIGEFGAPGTTLFDRLLRLVARSAPSSDSHNS
ncbi:MAG: alpha/beta hydrolase [Paracoccaceae bacterium]|nr:alpha/beta hydrolase [Paracoccaceae bacterium]